MFIDIIKIIIIDIIIDIIIIIIINIIVVCLAVWPLGTESDLDGSRYTGQFVQGPSRAE